ncbi:MAG TPA: hypothetical protein IAA29_16500, partial [Candidatus Paenibacillus intestinavium]|nr:hypothetical protein [Candidatus Paenibacillus intestinavium]
MDVKPNFSKFESESNEEKELDYEKFLVAQNKREIMSKIVKPIWIGLLILIGIAVLARIMYLLSGIPQKIDREFSAVQFRMDDETTVENTTITIKGKYYRQWFSYPKFEGSFIIDNYETTKNINSSYIA